MRTDLKELMEMDLDGAPYAYTPFCDDRPEMDGFRFVVLKTQLLISLWISHVISVLLGFANIYDVLALQDYTHFVLHCQISKA